jgi:hypothetical protein
MKVTVTEAAKLAGLSRSYFHIRYLKTGEISVERDENGKPQIDTAELFRVFGELKHAKQQNDSTEQIITHENSIRISQLEAENKLLREQLVATHERETAAQARELWMQQNIDRLTQTITMLEHKPKPRLGLFAKLFGK